MESRINAFGTTCYRQLLNISKRDHVTNEDVYARVWRRPLIDKVRARQLQWVGHLLRSKVELLSKYALLQPPNPGNTFTYQKQIATLLAGVPDYVEYYNDEATLRELAQHPQPSDEHMEESRTGHAQRKCAPGR
jgi:uncharacterized short protein YbdD (DUF466 family)